MQSESADRSGRIYHAEDMLLASHLAWLKGYLESTDPEIVPKVEMAIQREQQLRDKLYDAYEDLRELRWGDRYAELAQTPEGVADE